MVTIVRVHRTPLSFPKTKISHMTLYGLFLGTPGHWWPFSFIVSTLDYGSDVLKYGKS